MNTLNIPEGDINILGAAKNIDLLIGTTKHDGRASSMLFPFPKNINILLINHLMGGLIAPTIKKRKVLFSQYKSISPKLSSYLIHEQINTDALYRRHTIKAADIHSQKKESSTFMYNFNWESPAFNGGFCTNRYTRIIWAV